MQHRPNIEKQERTKKCIQDAFMKLYKKHPIESLSVRMITDAAGLTRSTFYVYYESVYDLLEKIEDELRDGMGPYFEQYTGDILHKKRQEPQDSVVKWFGYFQENSEYLRILLGPTGDPSFEYRLRKKLKGEINAMMDADGANNDYLRKYFVEYVVGANFALIRYWLENGEELSPQDVAIVANLIRQSQAAAAGLISN